MRIGLAEGSDQLGMPGLGAAGELGHQGRLAAARFAGDEAHLALAGQGRVEEAVQALQLAFAGDEYGCFHGLPPTHSRAGSRM